MTEQELIAYLIKGDENAFKVLVNTYKKMVYNTVLGVVQNLHDAEDVTQDVFIKVLRHRQVSHSNVAPPKITVGPIIKMSIAGVGFASFLYSVVKAFCVSDVANILTGINKVSNLKNFFDMVIVTSNNRSGL